MLPFARVRVVPLVLVLGSVLGCSLGGLPASAQEPPACVKTHDLGEVRAERCRSGLFDSLVKITVATKGENPSATTVLGGFDFGGGLRSLTVGGRPYITASGQAALRRLMRELGTRDGDDDLQSLAGLLANFIRPDALLASTDAPPPVIRVAAGRANGWTMNCPSVGHKRNVGVQIPGARSMTVTVGEPASGCYGRCGVACDGRPVYTEECLRHDVCAELTKQNMGPCSSYFWAAAPGFMSAPDCLPKGTIDGIPRYVNP